MQEIVDQAQSRLSYSGVDSSLQNIAPKIDLTELVIDESSFVRQSDLLKGEVQQKSNPDKSNE